MRAKKSARGTCKELRKAESKAVENGRDVGNMWDKAIFDAEQEIRQCGQRTADLRRAIVAFRELRDSGEPWPGTVESPKRSNSQQSGG
jgi:hypothetical protein